MRNSFFLLSEDTLSFVLANRGFLICRTWELYTKRSTLEIKPHPSNTQHFKNVCHLLPAVNCSSVTQAQTWMKDFQNMEGDRDWTRECFLHHLYKYSHVIHTANMMSLPQNKQRHDTESCRHQEDEAGVPGHCCSIHAVKNSHWHTVGEILKEGKTGKQGPCRNRKL